MKINRMDLADFGSPDKIVQGIIRLVPDLSIPVPIKELASQLDIVDFKELKTEGFEGGLLTDENRAKGIILTNENSSHRRQRFTIGHELGHFLCPWHKPNGPNGFLCSSDDMRRTFARTEEQTSRMEVEANSFAAQILMPAPLFKKDMRRYSGADIEHIITLSDKYDTSKEATARRYVELHEEPCAAIISRQKKILRMYRPKNFPFIEPSPGHPLPSGSLSAQANIADEKISDWEATDAALWIVSNRGQRLPSMYEQVLVQRDGYRLTLLSLEDEDEDKITDDNELFESWTPRHR